MLRRDVLKGIAAAGATTAVGTRRAAAQDVIKIGACLSLTGGFQTVGRQALAGAKLYMQLNGDRVAGKKIELIVREDSGVPDVARRVVQEMIVNEKISIVLGGITPTALAIGQLVTQAKIPTVVIISGASVTVERSPFMTRTSFTLGQSSMIMGDWAAKNGSKKGVSVVNYSAAHPSAANKKYVEEFKKANGFRPNFISTGGWDGMHLIYEALKKTNGDTDGEKLIGAMKGMKWESPRGPISIDPETRDIVQNIYMRKVEKVNGELFNVEFATFEAVKDPMKKKS